MHFRVLAVCLLLVSTSALAVGRSPAVEDFVGIEVDEPQSAPQGTEPLFNFEQDLSKHAENGSKSPELAPTTSSQQGWSIFSVIGIAMALALPMGVWLMLMSYLRKKASVESASNIEVLENYRKQREQTKKDQDTIRRVS